MRVNLQDIARGIASRSRSTSLPCIPRETSSKQARVDSLAADEPNDVRQDKRREHAARERDTS
jgi:hypothetical protein